MIGVDVGGSYFKFGVHKPGQPYLNFLNMLPLPYTKEFVTFLFENNTPVLITGAGAKDVIDLVGDDDYEIEIVPELLATGLGASYLAQVNNCIVVNIGSGTPVLYVDRKKKEVEHLGGTGAGSATIAGLSHYLTGIDDLREIGAEALKGDASKVNLLISDIYKNPDDIGIPGNITASNFGKYQNWRHFERGTKPTKPDFLAGIHTLVGETIAMISTLASRQYRENHHNLPIVITGGGALNPALIKVLKFTYEYLKQDYIIPEYAEYATLHGMFVAKDLFT